MQLFAYKKLYIQYNSLKFIYLAYKKMTVYKCTYAIDAIYVIDVIGI